MDPEIQRIWDLFTPLYPSPDKEQDALREARFLAHYTSIDVLEKIAATDEIWFSNPLFMNDLEEVKFGILQGGEMLRASKRLLNSLNSDKRCSVFVDSLNRYVAQFDQDHLFDTYVFCLSRHDENNTDGRLSMWRGYGGNGRGAAIIFDTSKIVLQADTPLILSRVFYGSADKRLAWVRELGDKIAAIVVGNSIPDDKVYLIASAAFERLKLFALFTKHSGFAEEDEWRIVYMPERDSGGLFKPMLHYMNGPRGVEPKLKLKVAPLEGVIPSGVTLDNIVAKILLGPTTSSVLAQRSVGRMLEVVGKPTWKERLSVSNIPLRGGQF